MNRNPCIGWADGDSVSYLKSDGTLLAAGRVVIRKSEKGRWYCKVRLLTTGTGLGRLGDWVWPEGWVLGQGGYKSRCFECRQLFLTGDQDEAQGEFCPACQRREDREKRAAGATAIRNLIGWSIASRDPKPPRQSHDPEGEAAHIAAQKAADDKASPF